MKRFILLAILACLAASAQVVTGPFVTSGIPQWQKYTVTAIANNGTACASATVSSAAFTGSGLNDATSSGTYTASGNHTYTVIIDATGTPDTYKWKKDSGSFTAGVAVTGTAQALADGIRITFAATTGHTLNDQWVITATDLGCWQVNNSAPVAKAAALTQNVALFTLPAGGFVHNARIKSAVACTGSTTLTTTLGTTGSATFFISSAYDLKAAVSNTNFSDAMLAGSDTAVATTVAAGLTSTVNNITAVATNCAFSVRVLWSVTP